MMELSRHLGSFQKAEASLAEVDTGFVAGHKQHSGRQVAPVALRAQTPSRGQLLGTWKIYRHLLDKLQMEATHGVTGSEWDMGR